MQTTLKSRVLGESLNQIIIFLTIPSYFDDNQVDTHTVGA